LLHLIEKLMKEKGQDGQLNSLQSFPIIEKFEESQLLADH